MLQVLSCGDSVGEGELGEDGELGELGELGERLLAVGLAELAVRLGLVSVALGVLGEGVLPLRLTVEYVGVGRDGVGDGVISEGEAGDGLNELSSIAA